MSEPAAVRLSRTPPAVVLVACAGAGALIGGLAAAGVHVTPGHPSSKPLSEGITRGLIAVIPVLVAFYASRQPSSARFGKLLLIFAGWWILAGLSASSAPLLYSIGRVSIWIALGLLIYAMLAFPSGQIESRIDRLLVAITAFVVIALFVPTALFVHRYPPIAPFVTCTTRCPRNVFMVLHGQAHFIQALREVLAVLVFVAVALRMLARGRAATRLMRRELAPVLVAAGVCFIGIASALVTRKIAPGSTGLHIEAAVLMAAVPGITLAVVLGLVRWRLFVNAAIVHVSTKLGRDPTPQQVRDAVAEAFEDPDLQIGAWQRRRRRYVDTTGRPMSSPTPASGRLLTDHRDGRRRAVAIVHDSALREEPEFLEATIGWAAGAYEHERQHVQSERLLGELKASRARIMAAGDDERKRIERDLHDGAQQRLVATRIELELAAEQVEGDAPDQAAMLRHLGDNVDDALGDIRSLTRGIYPAMLDRSLKDAIRGAASRSPIATKVKIGDMSAYPQAITIAVYFCIVEALQNVAKHATGATSAEITVRESGSALRFCVSDNGIGFIERDARVGAGMINMYDRLSTLGGDLTVDSQPGHGTRVSGRIPLSPGVHTSSNKAKQAHVQRVLAGPRSRRPSAA